MQAPGVILRVLYNFDAEEASELAVREGELVAVLDARAVGAAASGAAEGWTLVARLAKPSERGFVPSGASMIACAAQDAAYLCTV